MWLLSIRRLCGDPFICFRMGSSYTSGVALLEKLNTLLQVTTTHSHSTWGGSGSGGRVGWPVISGSTPALATCVVVVVSLGMTLDPPCLVWMCLTAVCLRWWSIGAEWLPSVYRRAAVATSLLVYHHRYDCVWMVSVFGSMKSALLYKWIIVITLTSQNWVDSTISNFIRRVQLFFISYFYLFNSYTWLVFNHLTPPNGTNEQYVKLLSLFYSLLNFIDHIPFNFKSDWSECHLTLSQ